MSDKFEHTAQQLLGNIELEPNERVWQHVKREITPDKRKRRFVFWWLLPIMFGGAGLVYYISSKNESNKVQQTAKYTPEIQKTQSGESVAGNSNSNYGSTRDNTDEGYVTGKEKKTLTIKTKANSGSNYYGKKNADAINDISTPLAITSKASTGTDIKQQDQEESVSTSPFKTAVADSLIAETKVAKPKDKIEARDTASADHNSPIVVNNQKHNGWQFGIIAETGFATLLNTGSANLLFSSSGTSGPLVSGNFNSYTYEKQQADMGALLSIGFTAKRSVSKYFDLHTSLGYMNQHFSIKSTRYKDSLNTHGIISQTTSFYELHSLNFSIGGNWYFSTKGSNRLGAAASFDNMYLFAANNSIAAIDNLSSVANFQKNNDLNSYNKWQPHLNLGLVASFTTNNKAIVQFSPFMRYALRPFEKAQQSSKKLMSFGLSARYFFR